MRPWRAGMPLRWPVGLKFAAAVGAVVLGVLSVSVIPAFGVVQLRYDVERLISDDWPTSG
jgi:hypothetical protein